MFGSMLRFVAVPLAVSAAVLLTGFADFTTMDRAVSKALASPGGQAKVSQESRLTAFVSPRLVLDSKPTPPIVPTTPDAAHGLRRPQKLSIGTRPGDGALVPLYASFVGLQALDVHSTLRALDRGGRETNGLMAPLTQRPAAFVALKAGSTAGILYLTERMRRHSPTAAIVMMAVFNSAYATVVANNYRIGNKLGRR